MRARSMLLHGVGGSRKRLKNHRHARARATLATPLLTSAQT